jgi:diguanylate cyclase (GGDEF)-like protein/PAS domain S-box-containing protein
MPDLLFRINKEGIVIDFKGGTNNRLGIPRWTSIGSKLDKLLPEKMYKTINNAARQLQGEPERVALEIAADVDDHKLFYEARLLPLPENQLLLILQDITIRKKAERDIALTNKRLELQNQTLFDIAVNPAVYAGDINKALKEIAETAANTLQVGRVAIWFYDEKRRYIMCSDLYEKNTRHHGSSGQLDVKDYPVYFRALATGRAIAAHDAQSDPSTQEFVSAYLLPNNITSLLAAPIRAGGHYIGVISHEQTGDPREWTPDEQHFAASMADMVSLVYETNARQKVQQALLESEERFRILAESSNSAIFAFRESFLYVNPAMEYLTDYTEQELQEKSVRDIFGDGFYSEVRQRLATGVQQNLGYMRRECMLKTKRGEQRWLFLAVGLVQLHSAPTYLASAFDITERKIMEEQLRHQAFHDKLTGLPNRALFMDRLEQCLTLIKRYPAYKSAVLFLDIDRFKVVNDSLGHLVGDKLLKKIATRLRKQMRECDTVARLGGDEFTVLIGDTQSPEHAAQIAGRIQKEFENTEMVDSMRRHIQDIHVDAKNLKIELTESAIIENPEHALEKLSLLKEMGIEISIDDFGTGYSSLSYLHKFPIDALKIDRSFVTEIGTGGQNTEIASAIISMAHSLGLKVVAEGVEKKGQLDVLIKLNCDYAQGFVFSPPVPVRDTAQFINRNWSVLGSGNVSIARARE